MASPSSPYTSTFDAEKYYSTTSTPRTGFQLQQHLQQGQGQGGSHPNSPSYSYGPHSSLSRHGSSSLSSNIHFPFERQYSESRGPSYGSVGGGGGGGGGGLSPLHPRSPHLSPSYYRTLSVGYEGDLNTQQGGGGGGGGGQERGSTYYPVVAVPLLSGAGAEGIPDFLKLVEEANERSGGLSALRVGPILTWEDVSAQLERPKGQRLEEEVDGGEVLRRRGGRKGVRAGSVGGKENGLEIAGEEDEDEDEDEEGGGGGREGRVRTGEGVDGVVGGAGGGAER